MISKSKFIMIAAVMTIAVASPAFAQSFSEVYGTGNVLPFAYGPGGIKLSPWALVDARRNHLYDYAPNSVRNALGHKEKLYMSAPSGAGAFAAVPLTTRSDPNPNSPALTGGGSLGYNQSLYNY